jgi:Kef-type K+ transport system membrane component KefB
MGFGFFIPVFFVTVGLRFDLDALLEDPANVAMVPIFLAALLAVRGLPALIYRGFVGRRRAAVAGLLQATSLPFIVAATAIGMELGALDPAEGAALISAGLLSVVIFPLTGLTLLRRAMAAEAAAEPGGVSSDAWPSAPISTKSASIPPSP